MADAHVCSFTSDKPNRQHKSRPVDAAKRLGARPLTLLHSCAINTMKTN